MPPTCAGAACRAAANIFPGMGRALADPHFSLPVVDLDERELFKTDLLPFLALCPALSSIMSAHIMLPQIDPDYPATLSERVIRGLLRDRLGFRGVVFTDDLCMGGDYGAVFTG